MGIHRSILSTGNIKLALKSASGLLASFAGLLVMLSMQMPLKAESIDETVREVSTNVTTTQERQQQREKLEKQRLDKLVNGWRARTYYSVREKPTQALVKGFRFAAEKARDADWQSLPEPAKEAARTMSWVARQLTGKEYELKDGEPDWLGMQYDIEVAMKKNNRRWQEIMTLTWLSLGQRFLAMQEMESAHREYIKSLSAIEGDPASASYTAMADEIGHRTLRGVVLALNGFSQLSLNEMNIVSERMKVVEARQVALKAEGMKNDVKRLAGKTSGVIAGWLVDPKVQQGVNYLIVYLHLAHSDLAQADFLLGKLSERYPNNPLTVFLTGQKHLESGEIVEVEKSLKNIAKDSNYKWLADTVSERISAARDNPQLIKPMVLDSVLLGDLMKAFLVNAALESKAIKEFWEPYEGMSELKEELEAKLRKIDVTSFFSNFSKPDGEEK